MPAFNILMMENDVLVSDERVAVTMDDLFLFVECDNLEYGYGCAERCECSHGTCNRNASHVNESCICDVGYQPPDCVRLVDACGKCVERSW